MRIELEAFAEDVAADLHERYGDFVELQVGALAYPLRATDVRELRTPDLDTTTPTDLDVQLDGPLTVRSGHTVTHGFVLTNRTDRAVTVHTNGQLTATVLDAERKAVGGFSGWQHVPEVRFSAEAGGSVRIPLLVGTASFRPELGYVIPPGVWHLVAPLDLADGRRLRTPALAFTVRR